MGESVSQETQMREKTHRALAEQLTELERSLLQEVSQFSSRESAIHEMREALLATSAKDRGHMEILLAKEQELRAAQLDNVNKQLLQEKAVRETQQESLRVYLTNEKLTQEGREKTFLKKDEYENETKRLWREVRNHTHDLNVQPRPVSPMVGSRRAPSPQPSSLWIQQAVASQSKASPVQTNSFLQQLAAPSTQQTGPAPTATVQQDQTYESLLVQSRAGSVVCSPGPSSYAAPAGEQLQFQWRSA